MVPVDVKHHERRNAAALAVLDVLNVHTHTPAAETQRPRHQPSGHAAPTGQRCWRGNALAPEDRACRHRFPPPLGRTGCPRTETSAQARWFHYPQPPWQLAWGPLAKEDFRNGVHYSIPSSRKLALPTPPPPDSNQKSSRFRHRDRV